MPKSRITIGAFFGFLAIIYGFIVASVDALMGAILIASGATFFFTYFAGRSK